ncbi:hypothetical protein [Xenophilus sp.]|uniref:hypothetical protein n=1 Tax=Xenophilus sp. TaxID=1873499 RepID=UPI0037DC1502
MTSIDSASRLAAMLAARMTAELRHHSPRAERLDTGREPTQDRSTSDLSDVSAGEDARLLQSLALAVGRLPADDPDRQRKAYRLFMEAMLARALDRTRFDDMDFRQLLDTVLQRMEDDSELHGQLREAGQLLLDAAKIADAPPPAR